MTRGRTRHAGLRTPPPDPPHRAAVSGELGQAPPRPSLLVQPCDGPRSAARFLSVPCEGLVQDQYPDQPAEDAEDDAEQTKHHAVTEADYRHHHNRAAAR